MTYVALSGGGSMLAGAAETVPGKTKDNNRSREKITLKQFIFYPPFRDDLPHHPVTTISHIYLKPPGGSLAV
jgi:hypothetical protein